jgi:hypothetical protein
MNHLRYRGTRRECRHSWNHVTSICSSSRDSKGVACLHLRSPGLCTSLLAVARDGRRGSHESASRMTAGRLPADGRFATLPEVSPRPTESHRHPRWPVVRPCSARAAAIPCSPGGFPDFSIAALRLPSRAALLHCPWTTPRVALTGHGKAVVSDFARPRGARRRCWGHPPAQPGEESGRPRSVAGARPSRVGGPGTGDSPSADMVRHNHAPAPDGTATLAASHGHSSDRRHHPRTTAMGVPWTAARKTVPAVSAADRPRLRSDTPRPARWHQRSCRAGFPPPDLPFSPQESRPCHTSSAAVSRFSASVASPR